MATDTHEAHHRDHDAQDKAHPRLAELKAMVEDGRVDTLIVAITDMQGRLMGKRVQAQAFLDGVIDLTAEALPRFGIPRPRLAIAGVNPHAGEEGLLGTEEERVVKPAVAAARSRGVAIAASRRPR